ncbi:MarR family transcriptional regulator [Sphingomonas sp. AP4-R1]|uniref:MarR family winged helix-turn-helix transcriptional regulator n=1 Tax=Sphingomonas sp. AP4-R1 TaxID=2735134 RepID=UPI001493431C|nr:MarR family transcriptional regulator [Sphingomonas sp. AP4-R1]QJU58056.1 MarR family transcriptional regulator [Sphingomonas sp. AP4-R1]
MSGAVSDAGQNEALGVLDSLVGYHLRRASAVFGSDFTRTVGGEGLRQVPFAILSVIAANPGIRQGAAGEALGIKRANMVVLINELAEGGLVERTPAEDDRRAIALALTTKGQATLEEATARLIAHENELLADFSGAERRTLIDLIRRIEAREQAPTD